MPPIGETLREARMRQHLDVADVEEQTKIRAKYLRALENEEWGLLPGPTFVKTFLRTYAEAVGVDPYVLVEEYRLNHEPPDETEVQALATSSREQPRRPRMRRRRKAAMGPAPRPGPRPSGRGALVAVVVVALLAFLVALGLLSGDDSTEPESASTTPTATEQQPTPGADDDAQRRQRQRQRRQAAGVRVRIAPIEETYVCVDTGAGTDVVFQDIVVDPQTFRNRRELRVNLGRRSAAVTLNGEPVEIAVGAEPIGLAFTPDGATEIPEGERPCA